MKRIIAFDPGETTGWAHGYLLEPGDSYYGTGETPPEGVVLDKPKLVVGMSGYDPWKVVALQFHRAMVCDEPKYDVVVYESWRLRRSSAVALVGSDMQSSQCIGCIKLACWAAINRGNVVEIVHNEPAEKSVIDAVMGGTDYLPKSEVEHDRDALRHLYHYAVFRGNAKPMKEVNHA